MKTRIKTVDGEIHVFSSADAIEPLQRQQYDPEIHIFRLKTGVVEYGFPLKNIIWVKMTKEEM